MDSRVVKLTKAQRAKNKKKKIYKKKEKRQTTKQRVKSTNWNDDLGEKNCFGHL